MRAKIAAISEEHAHTTTPEGLERAIPMRFSVDLTVTELPESFDQVNGWLASGVEFDLVPREE